MAEQLEYFRRANADRHRNQSNELRKYHRDIDSLIQIIRNAFHNGVWDFQSLFLETISRSQVFGVSEPNAVQVICEDANIKVCFSKSYPCLSICRKSPPLIHWNKNKRYLNEKT